MAGEKIPEESIKFHFMEFPAHAESGENNWKIENELKGFFERYPRIEICRQVNYFIAKFHSRISMERRCDINHKILVDVAEESDKRLRENKSQGVDIIDFEILFLKFKTIF
jgi:hypothetical protein